MNWSEITLRAITTKRLFYFDKEVNSTCTRICRQLDIEVFPDYSGQSYYKYNETTDTWKKKGITKKQKTTFDSLIFDDRLKDKFESSPSQILFVFEDDLFQGIVHFTDYGKKVVYHDLYKNFFEFEKKLKEFLIIKGFGADAFIKFFQFRADKSPKKRDEYLKKKQRIEKEKVNYPLDSLFTIDLLEFCYSSFHDLNGDEKPLIIMDSEKTAINKLRNLIMHNKDNTGISSTMPHDYTKFKSEFFEPVQIFKKIFAVLNKKIEVYNIAQRPVLNKIWLSNLNKISDSELHRLFFDYEKYI